MINNSCCSTTSALMFKPLREREAGRYTDKRKIKFSSYKRKAVAKSYMRKCANISPYMRRPLVIYTFARAPF
jgi:hypothetical protein